MSEFATVLLDSIIIDRANRQRKELRNIDELAQSIKQQGLIHAPVITRECVLVVGERRVTAMIQLGWTSCPVKYVEDLSDLELQLIELDENVHREDLTWQEHNDAIKRYHDIRSLQPGWTHENTADAIGMGESAVSKHLQIADAIEKKIPGVLDAPKYSTALGITQRNASRQQDTKFKDVEELVKESLNITKPLGKPQAMPENPERRILLENRNTLEFFAEVQTVPYNFIHCDFPYGVGTGDKQGQSAAKGFGEYDDSFDTYARLLSSFCVNINNFAAPSAHLMFWFSMDFYEMTRSELYQAGWTVNPFPLIWHKSNNQGILPDPNRGPRRIYETAFLASRGDRKIVRPVSNVQSFPVTKDHHQAEKPKAMLEGFFKMLVDNSTRMLDPTAGSGNALAVAEKLGADFSHGIEINEEYYDRAKLNLEI